MTSPNVLHPTPGITGLPRTGPRQAAIGLMPVRRPEQYADPLTRADTDPACSGTYLSRVPLNDTDRKDDELLSRTQSVHAAEAQTIGGWSA